MDTSSLGSQYVGCCFLLWFLIDELPHIFIAFEPCNVGFWKTDRCQYFAIAPRTVQWLTFDNLIKAEDESPFPALTQIEVYGNRR